MPLCAATFSFDTLDPDEVWNVPGSWSPADEAVGLTTTMPPLKGR